MPGFSSIWDVTPDTAHPRAKQLLGKSIVWDYGDEDSPLGNDTGADTFAAYLDFRAAHPERRIEEFLHGQLTSQETPDTDWEQLDPVRLKETVDSESRFDLLRRDDMIIGLAFAQLLLEGVVNAVVRERAIIALRRQGTDVILSFRGGGGEEARKKQLNEFQRVLESTEFK